MRISYWSSDVCSSDLQGIANAVATLGTATTPDHVKKLLRSSDKIVFSFDGDAAGRRAAWRALQACLPEIGRASCRARVCQDVSISGVADSLKKKQTKT